MTDDLRATLEAAVQQHSEAPAPAPAASPEPPPAPPAPAPAPVDSPAPATAPAPAQKNVDTPEPGKDKLDEGTEDEQNSEQNVDGDHKKEEVQARARVDRPPQSWKPAAKAKWNDLSVEVRQEISRREREMERGLAETAQGRKFVKEFHEAVAPFANRYRAANMSPVQAVRGLMYADHMLSSAPAAQRAQFMAKMISDYGIDVQLLDAALSGTLEERADPRNQIREELRQELAPIRDVLQRQAEVEQQAQQRAAVKLQQEIEAMSENTEKYPFFDMVRDDMADILEIQSKKGLSLSLDQAYTRAVAMNPEASKQATAQQQNQKAQRAIAASASVSGNPAALRTTVPPTDLRGTIEAAIAHHTGGRF